MASPLLNWIDTMFFGIRVLFSEGDVELPARPALQIVGVTLADDPANNRTVMTVHAMESDGAGGFVLGSPTAGWISVRSDQKGFRVFNDDGSGFIFRADNSEGRVWISGTLGVTGVFQLDNVSGVIAPATGVTVGSVAGTVRFAQQAPPAVTGSRGGNAALTSLLSALAGLGLITNSTTA